MRRPAECGAEPTTPAPSATSANCGAAEAMVPQTPYQSSAQVEHARSGADETPIVSSSAAVPGLARPSNEPAAQQSDPESDCAPPAPSREIRYEPVAERVEPSARGGQAVEPPPKLGSATSASVALLSSKAPAPAAEAFAAYTAAAAGSDQPPAPAPDVPPPEQMQGRASADGTLEGSAEPGSCGPCQLQPAPPLLPPTPPSSSEADSTPPPAAQGHEQTQPPPPPQSDATASTAMPQPQSEASAAAGVSVAQLPAAEATEASRSPAALVATSSKLQAAASPCASADASPHAGRDVCTAGAGAAASSSSLNSLTPELLLRVVQAAAGLTVAEQNASATAARAAGCTLLSLQAEAGDVAPGFTRHQAPGDLALEMAGCSPAAGAAGPLRSHCLGVAGASRELRAAMQQLLSCPKDAAAVLHARDGAAACAAAVIGWPELRRSLLGNVPPARPQMLTQPAAAAPSPSSGNTPGALQAPPRRASSTQHQAQDGNLAEDAASARGGGGARVPPGSDDSSPLRAGGPAAEPSPLPHPLQLRSSASQQAAAQAAAQAAGGIAAEAQLVPGPAVPSAGSSSNVVAGSRRSRRAAMRSSGASAEVDAWAHAAADKLLALAAELAELQGVPAWAHVAGLALAVKEHRLDCLRRAAQRRQEARSQRGQQQQGDQAAGGWQRPRQPNPEADALLALSCRLASAPLLVSPAGSTSTSSAASGNAGDASWPRYTSHLMAAAQSGDVRLLQALLGPPLPRLSSELPTPVRRGPRAAAEAALTAGLRRPQGPTVALLRPRRPLSARPWLPVAQQVLVVALGEAVAMRRLEAAALLVLQYGAPPDMQAAEAGRRRVALVALLGPAVVAAGPGHEGGVKPALTWRRLQEAVDGNQPDWTELCLAADVWRRRKLPLSAVPRQDILNRHWPGCAAAAADVVAAAQAAGPAGLSDALSEAVAEAVAEVEALHGREEAGSMLRRVAASGHARSGATARVLLRYLWTNMQCAVLLGSALAVAVHGSAVEALAEVTPRGALHSLAARALVAAGAGEQRATALERARVLLRVLLREAAEEGGGGGGHTEAQLDPAAAAAPLAGLQRQRRRLLDTLPRELADLLEAAVVGAARDGRADVVRVLLLQEQEQEGASAPPLTQESLGRVLAAAADSPPGPAGVEVVRLVARAAAAAAPASQRLQVAALLGAALTAAAERRRVDVATTLITAAATHLYAPALCGAEQQQQQHPAAAANGVSSASSATHEGGGSGNSSTSNSGTAAGALDAAARGVVAPALLRALQAGAADALATVIAAAVAASDVASTEAAAVAPGQQQHSPDAAGPAAVWRCYGLLAAALSELDATPGPTWRPAAGDAALALLATPPPQPLSPSASCCGVQPGLIAASAAFTSAATTAATASDADCPARSWLSCPASQQCVQYQCPLCCWYTPDGLAVVAGAAAATDRYVCGMMAVSAAQEAQAQAEERVRARAAAMHALLVVGRARPVRWQALDAAGSGGGSGGSGGVEEGHAHCGREAECGHVSQRVLDRLLLELSLWAVGCCSRGGGGGVDERAPRECGSSAGTTEDCQGCRYRRRHHAQPPLSTQSARTLLSVLAGGRAPASAHGGGAGVSDGSGGAGGLLAAGGLRPSPAALVAVVELVCSETAELIAGCCAATAGEQGAFVVLAPSHVLAHAGAAVPAAAAAAGRPAGALGPNIPPRALPHPLPRALRATVAAASVRQRQQRMAAVLGALLPPPHALITAPQGLTSSLHPAPTATAGVQGDLPCARSGIHQQQQVRPELAGCCYPLPTGALDDAAAAAVAAGSAEVVEALLAAAPLSPGGLCQVLRAVGQLARSGAGAAAAGDAAAAGASPAAVMSAVAVLAAVRRRYAVPQAVLDWLLSEAADAAAAAAAEPAAAGRGGGRVQGGGSAMGAVWLWRRAGASPWPWLLARGGRPEQPQQAQLQRLDQQQGQRRAHALRTVAAQLAVDGALRPLLWPREQVLWAGARLSGLVGGWAAAAREAGTAVEAWREARWGWL